MLLTIMYETCAIVECMLICFSPLTAVPFKNIAKHRAELPRFLTLILLLSISNVMFMEVLSSLKYYYTN